MSTRKIKFAAATVECSEAIDWEIVQVNFDTLDSGSDEQNRTSPCLMISANFEFSSCVQIDYHDGVEYGGDSVERIQLWRSRVLVCSGSGHEIDIAFALSDDAFDELRQYLKILLGSDCFHA